MPLPQPTSTTTALVTGASSGIGADLARELVARGHGVTLVARREDRLEELAAELAGPVRVEVIGCDVADPAARAELFPEVERRGLTVDILINNAGVSGSHPDLLNTETWDQQMSINARGVFLGMRAVIPLMQKSGGGSIVNTSSISGVTGQSFVHMGYNAAKGAVRMATKAAAVQFAPDGIRVNSVHPGLMPAMRSSMMTADPAVREKMLSAVPAGRVGRVEEVAYANLFLACDESSYVTGVELPVDGGFLAM